MERFRDDGPTSADWVGWHSGREAVAVLSLSAPVTAGGHFRSVWVGIDARGWVCAVEFDEPNRPAWVEACPAVSVDLEVPASEYRRFRRIVETNRGRFYVDRAGQEPDGNGLGRYYRRAAAVRRARELSASLNGEFVVVDLCAVTR